MERSISPAMMIRVIGKVMMATSPLASPMLKMLDPVRNCEETLTPKSNVAAKAMTRAVSQRTSERSRSGTDLCCSARSGEGSKRATSAGASGAPGLVALSGRTLEAPLAQCRGEARGNPVVERDCRDQ